MSRLTRLTRDQLAEFLPNPRTVKAFEELILTSGTTTPDEIIVINQILNELALEVGASDTKATSALDLLNIIKAEVSALKRKKQNIPICDDLPEELYLPTPVKIRQEYQEAASGGTALVSGAVNAIANIALPAGDWEIYGYGSIDTNASTTLTQAVWGAHTSPSGYGATGSYFQLEIGTITHPIISAPIPTVRFALSAPATIYLNVLCTFAVSICTAYGKISARRIYNG